MKSRTYYSIINTFASLGGYALNLILSFICRIFFVRLLNSEYLGINGLFTNILSMLSLAELGIGTAMIYALYKPVAEDDKDKIASYMHLYGIAYKTIGIVIAVMGLCMIPFLKVLINNPPHIQENITLLYLLFLFSTVSSYFFSYRSSILFAYQENYIVLSISYIFVVIQNIVQIISLVIFKNYIIYLILQVLFTFASNGVVSYIAKRKYPFITNKNVPKLSKDEMWSLAKNVKALTVTKISGIIVNNTDNIVITYFKGLITTGIISNYTLLVNALSSLVNQIFSGLTGSVGNLNALETDDRKYIVFKSLNLINFWVYGLVSVFIIVVSNDVIKLFFGASYITGIEIPIILALNFYMNGMQCVVGIYKSTMGLFKYGQYILLITAFLNLIGDFILGKAYGVFGIFLATAISRLLTNTFYEPYIIFNHGFNKKFSEYVKRYLIYFILIIISTCFCFIVTYSMNFNVLINIILKCIVCLIIPNFIFYITFHKSEEFSYFINILKRIIRKIYEKIGKEI